MAKKPQKQQKSQPQKKQEVVKTQEKSEVTSTSKASTAELITKVAALLKQEGAVGYVCGVVGSDAKILPYVGAASIGDLLTIKYAIDKEISRLIDGQSSAKEAAATSSQQ